jgi:hypothetical protein
MMRTFDAACGWQTAALYLAFRCWAHWLQLDGLSHSSSSFAVHLFLNSKRPRPPVHISSQRHVDPTLGIGNSRPHNLSNAR